MFNMNKSMQDFLIICISVPLIIKYLDFHLVIFCLSQALLSVLWVEKVSVLRVILVRIQSELESQKIFSIKKY